MFVFAPLSVRNRLGLWALLVPEKTAGIVRKWSFGCLDTAPITFWEGYTIFSVARPVVERIEVCISGGEGARGVGFGDGGES